MKRFGKTGKGIFFREYELRAMETASFKSLDYLPLGLAEEVGELLHEYARVKRKNVPMDLESLKSECGDVLWVLSQICRVHGFSLEEAAEHNIEKLASRQKQGTIHNKLGRNTL